MKLDELRSLARAGSMEPEDEDDQDDEPWDGRDVVLAAHAIAEGSRALVRPPLRGAEADFVVIDDPLALPLKLPSLPPLPSLPSIPSFSLPKLPELPDLGDVFRGAFDAAGDTADVLRKKLEELGKAAREAAPDWMEALAALEEAPKPVDRSCYKKPPVPRFPPREHSRRPALPFVRRHR